MRNDKISRQWLLLRCLEGSKGATLAELVDSLPEDLPQNLRTVRRDLAALESAGFPLLTDRWNGQTRWRLMEHFHGIPQPSFSTTELMSLIFSRNLLRPLEGTEIQASLSSALRKAAAALPSHGHDYIREKEGLFHVGLDENLEKAPGRPLLGTPPAAFSVARPPHVPVAGKGHPVTLSPGPLV